MHKQIERRARLMKWFGLDREKSTDMRCNQDPSEYGYKMQLNDVMATIGLCNMKSLEFRLSKMQTIVQRYEQTLINNRAIKIVTPENGKSSNWLCTVIVNDSEDFIRHMSDKGIECSRVHDRNDTKKVFHAYKQRLSGVEYFNDHHVCIPCGWWLNEEDVERICNALTIYK